MKKILLFLLCIYIFNISVYAKTFDASEYVLMDINSGRVFSSKDMNNPRLIASITKIMTCILVLENSELSSKVEVGEEILDMYGTNIYIEVGEVLTIEDLLYGLMLRSGNDAAIVLSKSVFGSEDEFVKKMNEKAKILGMNNTIFNNPHGLDDNTKNYSTAYDMAILARYAYKNSEYRKIISTKKYITKSNLKSYEWFNRMKLLGTYKFSLGGKNGYTPSAGKTLVSYASNNELNLIAVTLNDGNIYENQETLFNNYFNKCKNYTIIDKNNFNIESSLINTSVYLKKSFIYPLCDDEYKNISTIVKMNNDNNKPEYIIIKLANKEIGRVKIYYSNKKRDDLSLLQRIKNLFVGQSV